MKTYGILDNTIQIIADDTYVQQENEILMKGERPTIDHIATNIGEWVLPLENVKAQKINTLGQVFAKRRDRVRFIDGLGFDCEHEDIGNFMSSFTPLLVNKTGTTLYKVWTSETTKGIVELTYAQMQKVYDAVRSSQMQAYVWYETKKASVNACNTLEELNAIVVE